MKITGEELKIVKETSMKLEIVIEMKIMMVVASAERNIK